MRFFLILSFFTLCLCVSAHSQDSKPTATPTPSESGSGQGNGIGTGAGESGKGIATIPPNSNPNAKIKPIRVLSKPRANYTEAARNNGVEGAVRVRVTFLASGQIGAVTPVSELPDGLTEEAIEAARQILFEPQTADGKPVQVTKTVEYSFSIIYKENDEVLKSNAEIVEMPMPENPVGELFKNSGGRVFLSLVLWKDGRVGILQVNSSLSNEFKEKAVEAAGKIKFKPAVNKNGKEVSQGKEIEYEFKPQSN